MKGISDLVDAARESLEIQKASLEIQKQIAEQTKDSLKILREIRVRVIEKLP